MLSVIDGGAPAKIIEGTATEVKRQETLDDIADDYRRARVERDQARALLKFREEALDKAHTRWIEAKAERGLE